MILNVDLASDVPIYQQLRDRIVEAIADGVLAEGSSLPATRTLAADFGINFHTVNKAYDLLRQQGLIRLNRKTGAVVTPTAADPSFRAEWTARARTLLAEAVAKGLIGRRSSQSCRSMLDSFRNHAARGHAMTVAIVVSSVLSALVLGIALVLPAINSPTVPFGVRVPAQRADDPTVVRQTRDLPLAGSPGRDRRHRGLPCHLRNDRRNVAIAAVGAGARRLLVRLLLPGQPRDPGRQGRRRLV